MVYRTQAVAINRIVIVSEGDREECLGTIINVATFVGRRLKYGMVEIKFATKEKAASHAPKILRSEKLTYCRYISTGETFAFE